VCMKNLGVHEKFGGCIKYLGGAREIGGVREKLVGCMRNFPHLWRCMKKKYGVDSNQLKFMDGP
jgi:hypothetical protein